MSKPRYALLFVISAAVSSYALVVFTSIPGQSLASWWFAQQLHNKAFVFLFGALAGLLVAMQAFLALNLRKRPDARRSGEFGASLASGIAATVCCSPFFVGLLGLTSVASLVVQNDLQLPLIALSLLLLVYSVHRSAKVIYCEKCQVKLGVSVER